MATAPSASYLPGEDPDAVEANRRYQEALAKLTESLDTRKNRFFDPTLLAAAAGFLAPTQTGGFGESLGKAAANIGPAQAAALKEEQDIAQQRLAVAGQGLELQRLKARDAELGKYLNPQAEAPAGPLAGPKAMPVNGPLSAPAPNLSEIRAQGPAITPPAAPAGALSQAAAPAPATPVPAAPAVVGSPQGALTAMEANKPPGYEGVEGIQVAPANPNFMTGRDYVRLNRYDKSKSPGDLIKEGQEIEQKRYRDKEGGVLDLATGKFYQFPTGKTEEIQLYGYPGTHKVDARTAARLSMLAAKDDPAYHDLAKRVVEGPRRPGPASEGQKPTSLMSVQELELETEKKKKLQGAEVTQEVEDRKSFVQRGRDADDTITLAGQFRKFAADPSAAKMAGILNNDKVSSGVARLVQDGIGSGSFRIGVPQIEDVMRNAGLNREDQAKYRTFLMLTVESQLAKTKYMKGAVSNFEQSLLSNAGINAQDTPETIRMKADLFTRRAQFDRRVARDFKTSKMTADDYLDSDRYAKMRDQYNTDLSELSFGGKVLVPATSANTPSTPAVSGQPSAGFIRDPQTGVIRKKKAGE
tara:strand:- start:1826 stop:3577 length:1752 start_codon:yes stop_codon:yes gene_type:complete